MFDLYSLSFVLVALFSLAIGTYALVVELCIGHFRSIARCVALHKTYIVEVHVIDLAALRTHKVCVGVGEAVEVRIDTVNAEDKYCSVLVEQMERVINGCARKGRTLCRERILNIINGWVCAVCEQIIHHCNPLHRGTNPETLQILFRYYHNFVRFVVCCNNYKTVVVAKVGTFCQSPNFFTSFFVENRDLFVPQRRMKKQSTMWV